MRYHCSYGASNRRRLAIILAWLFLLAAGFGGPSHSNAKTWDVIVMEDVMVPMRDGVKLATDLYVPAQNGYPVTTRLPALLFRTPYNKQAGGKPMARFFAEHGYFSVAQDVRGRFKSEGVFVPLQQESDDGYDTIEWVADHPFCNGKVGMHGVSYLAWTQLEAAAMNPPALVTMIPFQGPINAYHYSLRGGGALHLGLLKWILSVAATSQKAAQDPEIAEAIREMMGSQSFLEWSTKIPWQRGKTPLARLPAYENAALELYFDNYEYNDFWRQPGLGMDEHFDRFPEMPILWVTSWFDWYPRTLSDGYQKMVAMGRKDQHLLIGPWTHANFRSTVGDVNFGNQGGTLETYDDFLRQELAWFDHWMKGDQTVDLGKPVKFFMMGGGDGKRGEDGRLNHGGRWRHTSAWPPRGVEPTKYYLSPGGGLTPGKPTAESSSTTYCYDPANTVSSNGRCIISYGPAKGFGFSGMGPRDQIDLETLPGHGFPGKRIAERPDVVVFETPILTEDLRIAGNIDIDLWISSDAPDTDFYVKLLDVYPPSDDYPDGYSFPVSEGILRARYRDGFEKSVLLETGNVYRLEFPLEPAANLFRAGNRLRIYICSSNFPNFDINPNTGDPNDRRARVANNTIHHDSSGTSHITLPIWPSKSKE